MFSSGNAVIDQVILRQHFNNSLRMRIEHKHLGKDAACRFDKELRIRREVIGIWEEALCDELPHRCGSITPRVLKTGRPEGATSIQRIQDNVLIRIEVLLDELACRVVNDDSLLRLSLGKVV